MPYGFDSRQRHHLYRGVEQLVARRAHNPEVVWFKSHPRNQKEKSHRVRLFFLTMDVICTLRFLDYEADERSSLGAKRCRRKAEEGAVSALPRSKKARISTERCPTAFSGTAKRLSRRSRRKITGRSCGSSPTPATKKFLGVFRGYFFGCYPSRRLGISSPREVRCISSKAALPPLYLITRQRAFSCDLMIYKTKVLMICNSCGIDDIQRLAPLMLLLLLCIH